MMKGSQTDAVKEARRAELLWDVLLTILLILCFPCNPLVLAGVIEVNAVPALFVAGCVVWGFGMVLVMAPIVLFPRRGSVPRGRSFVYTTRLVDTGIYAIVRHPQYTGGIFAVFLTTVLWYPHWLFAVLGAWGSVLLYYSCRAEDRRLVAKFGDAYSNYMNRVPGMNLAAGIIRLIQPKRLK
ncbi:MAG: isoprenylcysteine carboxylmethyltransferase family protein [Dehalococcoidia bacterium]|nr:isoprenylcysteine carboxylmethyltransferase family protein [Dehalococcoidia bacterium]